MRSRGWRVIGSLGAIFGIIFLTAVTIAYGYTENFFSNEYPYKVFTLPLVMAAMTSFAISFVSKKRAEEREKEEKEEKSTKEFDKKGFKFCIHCGKDVPVGANFCPSCGNNLLPTQFVTTHNMSQEKVMSIIVLIKKTNHKAYALVITNKRCIFAQLEEELIRRRQKAKEEGKGFFGQWKASRPKNLLEYAQKYSNMEPESILQETNGNYSIDNSEIDSIEFTTTIWYQSFLGKRYNYKAFKWNVKLVIDSKVAFAAMDIYVVDENCLTRRDDEKQEPYYPKDLDVLQKVFGQKIKILKIMAENPTQSGPIP